MKIYIRNLVLHACILMVMSILMDGFYISSITSGLLVAVVLSLLNTYIQPILSLLSWPITFLSLGIFQLVINAFILYFTSFLLGSKFVIDSPVVAFFGAIVFSILSNVVGAKDEK